VRTKGAVVNLAIDPADTGRLRAALDNELAANETLIWSARPDPRRMLIVLWFWAFALPWTLFALFWEGTTLSMFVYGLVKADPNFHWFMAIFPIFGLPFVGVGCWMMWKPVSALLDARQQIHGLTNRRLMTLTLRKDKQLVSADLTKIGPIRRKEKTDGWGNLTVETGSRIDNDGDRITEKFEVYGVPDVANLERLLREAQQAA
jgi:hypothetical protein